MAKWSGNAPAQGRIERQLQILPRFVRASQRRQGATSVQSRGDALRTREAGLPGGRLSKLLIFSGLGPQDRHVLQGEVIQRVHLQGAFEVRTRGAVRSWMTLGTRSSGKPRTASA